MKYQINGLDFDIEVGAIHQKAAVYAFYGAFPNAYYHNYGFGVDYYFNISQNIYLSAPYDLIISIHSTCVSLGEAIIYTSEEANSLISST